MIVIISDDEKEIIGTKLYEYYKSINEEIEFISASSRNIKPCYGCNGCTYKTYGKCVFRDDMDEILPILIKGDIVIYTSPLIWGGFSYDVKKILDKNALIGDRFYKVKNKELVKGMISNMKKVVGVAVSEKVSEKEQSTFESYVRELGTIMDINYMGTVLNTRLTDEEIEKLAKEVLSK